MAVTKKVAQPVETAAAKPAPAKPAAAVAAPAPVAAPVAAPAAAMSDVMKPFAALPETFRANAEDNIEKMRAQYATFKGNAESISEQLEESMSAAQAGVRVFNSKVLDLFRAQADAGFAHLSALFNAGSVSEAFKLQQDYSKAQVDALKAQSQDLADYARQVAEQVSEPVKKSIVLPFKGA